MRKLILFVFAAGLIAASVAVAHVIPLTDTDKDLDFSSGTPHAQTLYPNPAVVAPFPDPNSMLLLGAGLLVLAALLRKKAEA